MIQIGIQDYKSLLIEEFFFSSSEFRVTKASFELEK